MRRAKPISVIALIIVSSVAAGLIWLSMNTDPSNDPNGPLDDVYNEAPMLRELVENGTLPPVEDRLPTNPMLIQLHDEVGIYGGTWRMGLIGLGSAAIIRSYACYEGLLRWDPTWSRILPNLAQSYDVNEDASEFTFHLRKGLRWSDGYNFTADDILFWYEDDLLNEELHPSINNLFKVNDTPGVVEKMDNHTVKFSFVGPYGLFPFHLASVSIDWIASRPKHYMKQFHIDYNSEGINELIEEAGVDTWVQLYNIKFNQYLNPDKPNMHAWTLQNSYSGNASFVWMERNPYYWKIDTEYNQLPYIDRINFTVYSSKDALRIAAMDGQIDMQHSSLEITENYHDYIGNMTAGDYSIYNLLDSRSNAMAINLNLLHEDPVLRSIFSNKTFRIALSHALNRTEIIEQVYGVDLEPRQPAPRLESPYYRNKLETQYVQFNLTLANELLDIAGYNETDVEGYRLTPDGHRINFTISYETSSTKADLVAEYWNSLGISVIVVQVTNINQHIYENQHDVVISSSKGGYQVYLEPGIYMPFDKYNSYYAIPWALWYQDNSMGEEPPASVKEQMQLYNQLKASNSFSAIGEVIDQMLATAEEEFYVMGVCLNPDSFLLVKNNFHNVPPTMPRSWTYPTPAPTNPCQYYINPQNSSTSISRAGIIYEISPDCQLSTLIFDGCCFVTKDR